MKKTVYLDYAATTPVDARVAATMCEYLTPTGYFGNASSTHAFGTAARAAVETARAQVAATLHAEPTEIIFTGSATESINLALKGAAQLYRQRGQHIITLKTEHAATLDTCEWLEKNGFSVTYLTPASDGILTIQQLENALQPDTILVSILHVNNETGVLQDIAAIATLTAARGILLHIDAAQTIGKIALDIRQLPVDLMSLNAHKIYGPKGIGALYLRRKPRVRVAAQLHGGGQEQGMRSGTLATHQIVGMGAAFALALNERETEYRRIQQLRDNFLMQLTKHNITFNLNGSCRQHVPHILNLAFADINAHTLMAAIPNLAISAGSACHAKGTEPSHVLRAMGLSATAAACCVRISFGRFTTSDEIITAANELITAIHILRH